MGIIVASIVLGVIMSIVVMPLQKKLLKSGRSSDYVMYLLVITILSSINIIVLSKLIESDLIIFDSEAHIVVIFGWIFPFCISSICIYIRTKRLNNQRK